VSITQSVEETISCLELAPEDAGIAELAREYARTLDRAAAIAAAASKVMMSLEWDDMDAHDQIKQILKRVSAHASVSDIGPKLLTCLDALSATPKSRASVGKPPKSTSAAAGKLHMLRSSSPG
jgi:hypothetical protein